MAAKTAAETPNLSARAMKFSTAVSDRVLRDCCQEIHRYADLDETAKLALSQPAETKLSTMS
jgi:hypothetical protein